MEYLRIKRVLLVAFVSGVAVACAPSAKESISHDNDVESTKDANTKFFMAIICAEERNLEANHILLPVVDASRAEGRDRVCVDKSKQLSFDEAIFRILVIGPHENYIQLQCGDKAKASRTINTMPEGGELALVVDKEVISTYHYLDKHSLVAGCGVIPASDLNVAVDVCEDVISRLNGNEKDCSSVCDAEVSPDLGKICLVANAKSPLL